MRLTDQQRGEVEARLRAAMERLLTGVLPPGAKCDLKTLAAEAGISRNTLYTSYPWAKEEFERRRQRMQDAGQITDPRDAQIARLKDEVAGLKQRLTDNAGQLSELAEFKARAISAISAQYDEIQRLRSRQDDAGTATRLPSARDTCRSVDAVAERA